MEEGGDDSDEPRGEADGDEESEDEDTDTKIDPDDDEETKAKKAQQKMEEAKDEIKELEEMDAEELPADIKDWPSGAAKYETFGGPEGEEGYEESVTAKLGPSSLRHHEDGSVEIAGDKVGDLESPRGGRSYGDSDSDDDSDDDEGSSDGQPEAESQQEEGSDGDGDGED